MFASARICLVVVAVAILATSCSSNPRAEQPSQSEVEIDPGDGLRIRTTAPDGQVDFRLCTLGAVLETSAEPTKHLGLTAGHCGRRGDEVRTDNKELVGTISDSTFGSAVVDDSTQRFSTDRAVIEFTDTIRPISRAGTVSSSGTAIAGDQVCALGVETGRTCGTVLSASSANILTTIRTQPGDSGAPLIRSTDKALIGTLTASVSYRNTDGGDSVGSFFNQVEPILLSTGSHVAP